jgi:hypothetical protein
MTKWIIPLRSMVGEYGHAKRDVPIEVDDDIAKKLIDNGKAVPDPNNGKGAPQPEPKAAPQTKRQARVKAAKEPGQSAENPLADSLPGGQTGEAGQSSVSEGGQAPEPQTSISSEGSAQG